MTLDAQTGAQGAITGIVVTDDAAPVPGAQIRLSGRGSAAAREVSSDASSLSGTTGVPAGSGVRVPV